VAVGGAVRARGVELSLAVLGAVLGLAGAAVVEWGVGLAK
ncbi:hypothetical protein PF001_g8377, partial [Phytophthora fragariae]